MNLICKTDEGVIIPNKGMMISGAVTKKPNLNLKKIKVVFADGSKRKFDVIAIQTSTSIIDAMNVHFVINTNLPSQAFLDASIYAE